MLQIKFMPNKFENVDKNFFQKIYITKHKKKQES